MDHVTAGTTLERRLEVRNGTGRPLEPRLSVAPGAIGAGSFAIDERGGDSELTRWSSIEPDELTIQAGERAIATLRIDVPDDAEDGEYYGAALAEVTSSEEGAVSVVSRVGVRIYLSVGDVPPPTDFEITELSASRLDDGRPVLTAEVENTGGRALDMSGELELDEGPAGLSAGPFPAELGRTLAIGETQPVRVVLDQETPAGPWEATLTLRSGRIERAVTGTITFPEVGEETTDVTFERLDGAKRPVALIAGVLVLVVLVGAVASMLARRPRLRRRLGRDRSGTGS